MSEAFHNHLDSCSVCREQPFGLCLEGAQLLLATEHVVTHGGSDRGGKLCLCSSCGAVERCTPARDFYTTIHETGPLLCEDCFWQHARDTLGRQAMRN